MDTKGGWNIISLGGSLVMPGEIDIDFIADFRNRIRHHIRNGQRFLVIDGGGKISRWYQAAFQDLSGNASSEDIDWIGIAATRLNAEFLQRSFEGEAFQLLMSDPDMLPDEAKENSLLIGHGWRPGWSTDYVAVCFAEKLQAKRVINLSNIDYVYTADPKKDASAEKITQTTWSEYLSYIPEQWQPGLSSPFDPIAAKKAKKIGLSLSFVAASDLDNFDSCIQGDSFPGTIITA
jgi:uridylate kinase